MVPCDAGCDGPICSSMISSDGSDGTILSFQRAGSDMVGIGSGRQREERIGFTTGSISGTIGWRLL